MPAVESCPARENMDAEFTSSGGEADDHESKTLSEDQRRLAEDHIGVAVAYVRSRRFLAKEEQDNIQVGLLAIVKAAATYGPHVGCDFGAYAYQRVRRAIADHLSADRPIRIPVDGHRSRYKSRIRSIERAKELAGVTRFTGLSEVRPSGDEARELGRSREPTPNEACERAEAIEVIRDAVASLPPNLRATIEAVCLEGRGMAEYARERRRWPSSVRNQREQGFKAIRRAMEARGWTIDD